MNTTIFIHLRNSSIVKYFIITQNVLNVQFDAEKQQLIFISAKDILNDKLQPLSILMH